VRGETGCLGCSPQDLERNETIACATRRNCASRRRARASQEKCSQPRNSEVGPL